MSSESEVPRLKALRRKNLSDGFVDDYDKTDDGDKVKEITVPGPANTTKTVEINQSRLYRPAPSTTNDVEILRIEARMVADGEELDNPHVPSSDEVLEQATEAIADDGNTPAWEET